MLTSDSNPPRKSVRNWRSAYAASRYHAPMTKSFTLLYRGSSASRVRFGDGAQLGTVVTNVAQPSKPAVSPISQPALRRPAMRSASSVLTRPTGFFVLSFSMVLLNLSPKTWAADRMLDSALHHLGDTRMKDWTDVPPKPEGKRYDLRFSSAANAAEWTLSLKQRDVED